MNEPLWRNFLCWGAVIAFFTVPVVALAVVILIPTTHEHLESYKFVGTFFQSVAALVFGLAGLKSFDRYVEMKNGDKKSPSVKT